MRLLAISDLHLGFPGNMRALSTVEASKDDWLILAGDICERRADLRRAFEILAPRFARLVWVPGNHELWSTSEDKPPRRGEAKYLAMVEACREFGVLTPEDEYARFGEGPDACLVVPLFLLYDYSFRPDHVPFEEARGWALEHGIECADEQLLHHEPHDSKEAWCRALCRRALERLERIPEGTRTVLVNHFPLKYDLVHIPRIPRFSIWCGTKLTEEWHVRFNAVAVVSGHLHVRSTRWRDGVRFEEVSLGYPRQWDAAKGVNAYIREILPGPAGNR